ncbi:NAD(P)H-dependent oxidoreductase [Gordonia neofelifaecis]|uniref:NADPH-dependent FMN reductase n=1 Tax=Gordonia neofelifaecis NRRL B-59395 TaxID=644548 RepID=F1YES1_9ACTN|nr:NAD(P)H-dependent oxidoreductase [Gordonia neofelifaecis]EGD56904.1 NADPH-dependent FMN reductase [Gordonia neofelifaecis NRRL B-59395]
MSEGNINIAVLVGSLRAGSHNRALAELAAANAPEGVSLTIVEGLNDVPFYNEDIDTADAIPAAAAALRDAGVAADAFLFVTPEYNGTMSAVLKNAIDWLSRPYGAGALSGKPAGVIGAALGQYAGTWSRQDTRKSIGIAGANVVEAVEIGIGTGALGDEGVATAETIEQLVEVVRVLTAEVAVAA